MTYRYIIEIVSLVEEEPRIENAVKEALDNNGLEVTDIQLVSTVKL
jgi:hypothetical protein